MLGALPLVDLAGGGGAEVVALGAVLAPVPERVGARRHRLGLERLDLGERRGRQLVRHHAPEVVFEIDHVDQGEGSAVRGPHLQVAAIARLVGGERVPGPRGHDEGPRQVLARLQQTESARGRDRLVLDHEGAGEARSREPTGQGLSGRAVVAARPLERCNRRSARRVPAPARSPTRRGPAPRLLPSGARTRPPGLPASRSPAPARPPPSPPPRRRTGRPARRSASPWWAGLLSAGRKVARATDRTPLVGRPSASRSCTTRPASAPSETRATSGSTPIRSRGAGASASAEAPTAEGAGPATEDVAAGGGAVTAGASPDLAVALGGRVRQLEARPRATPAAATRAAPLLRLARASLTNRRGPRCRRSWPAW